MVHLYVALLFLIAMAIALFGWHCHEKWLNTLMPWDKGHKDNGLWGFGITMSVFAFIGVTLLAGSLFR